MKRTLPGASIFNQRNTKMQQLLTTANLKRLAFVGFFVLLLVGVGYLVTSIYSFFNAAKLYYIEDVLQWKANAEAAAQAFRPFTAHRLDRSLWSAEANARFEHVHREQGNDQNAHDDVVKRIERNRRKSFTFELDKPRFADEADFFHDPKSNGGSLHFPTPERVSTLRITSPQEERHVLSTAKALHSLFSIFDRDERAVTTMPVFATMCVGVDCKFIPRQIASLNVGVGHFLVVVSTDDHKYVGFFRALHALFPGRFTAFFRAERLSCAESWNLATRIGFAAVKPTPDQVFLANADWAPGLDPRYTAPGAFRTAEVEAASTVANHFSAFCVWSRTQLQNVVALYSTFSAFSLTRRGYLELGYFDEAGLYPSLGEDVEFHCKATSKGLGAFNMYEHGLAASMHQVRGSVGEKKVDERYARVARNNYIWQKWNVDVRKTFWVGKPHHPWKCPWNNCEQLAHNNSWAVDPVHRLCAMTGVGPTFNAKGGFGISSSSSSDSSQKKRKECWYDARVLKSLLPKEKQPLGSIENPEGDELMLPVRVFSYTLEIEG